MYEHVTSLRVKYADTDQMGYVYYGRYLEYLEVARTEVIRSLGLTYHELETQHNVALPVMDVQIRYLAPGRYDDILELKTIIKEKPGVRIKFSTEIIRADGKLLNIAEVRLCFIDIKTEKPTRPPEAFMEKLAAYFE